MVVLQCINKIIQTGNYDIVIDNNLSKEMFLSYENEFEFIDNFYKKYGKVPDKETFLTKFQQFQLLEVNETEKYLVDKINEEYLYYKSVPVVQTLAEKLKVNSNEAVEYLLEQIPKLTNIQQTEGINIIEERRYKITRIFRKIKSEKM